jgi:cell division transport system permease protein
VDTLRSKVELEAFIQEPASDEDIAELQRNVEAVQGVEKVVVITKEEAAKIFRQEFGEDILSVLDFNPLPPSLKISLREGFRTSAGAQAVYDRVRAMKGIESVVYRKALLDLIDRRTATVHNVTLGLGVLISLSSVFLVSNTIRLAIYSKRKLIRTMQLVGATSAFIRFPFLLEGIVQGLIGGVLAATILYLFLERAIRYVSAELALYLHMEPVFYPAVVVAGTVLGLVGSVISVARFIHPTEAV